MFQRIKALFGPQDMTKGSTMSALVNFSVPLLIGNFAQQLYSTVDSIVVGKYVGDEALSAIGATNPIINLLLVLFMAIATGAGIMVAQYFGAKARDELSKSVGNSITLITIASLAITAIGIPLADALLTVTKTPVEIYSLAKDYLVIILIGMVGSGFYNIISGILRGLGESIFPLLALLLASGLNIVLDIWFVAGLKMSVAGAAWATIISQSVSAVFCIIKLFTLKKHVDLSAKEFVPEGKYTGQLLKLGLPAGLTQAIFSLSMVTVQALTNSMGYRVVTTSTAVMRIDGFAMLPNFTFGMAISTFVGQNMGAGKMDRVKKGIKDCTKLGLSTSVVLVACLNVFATFLLKLFTTTDDVISLGISAIRVLSFGYIAMAVMQIFGGTMRGAGDTMPTMWISLITTVVIRVPLAYLLAYLTRSETYEHGNPIVLFVSLLTSWVIGAAANYFWYRRGKWMQKGLVKHDDPVEVAE